MSNQIEPGYENVDAVCKAFKQYFEDNAASYDGDKTFSRYCLESMLSLFYLCTVPTPSPYSTYKFKPYQITDEMDDDNVAEEINENENTPEECQLFQLDTDDADYAYWENFPGIDNQSDKALYLFNKIKDCWQNPKAFNSPFKIDDNFFNITEDDVDKTSKILSEQCPELYKGMATDQTILKVVAIGHKNNMDYLQYLVDDYFKFRAEKIGQNKVFKVEDWVKNHPHFNVLKRIKSTHKLEINAKSVTIEELIKSACNLYGKRFLPQLQYHTILKIDDSLEVIVRYIEAAVLFIANLFGVTSNNKTKRGICPFQFDLCISSGASIEITKGAEIMNDKVEDEKKSNDLNNQRTGDNKKNNDIDYIGDIKERLNANDIKFEHTRLTIGGIDQERVFTRLLEDYKQNNKLEEEKEHFAFPHGRRIIAFIDRRESKHYTSNEDEEKCKDDIYLYPPPNDCRNIPTDAKSEWYLNSSKTCLLPHTQYEKKEDIGGGSGSGGIANDDEEDEDQDGNDEKEMPLNDMNIGTASNIKGSVLTISFHVMSQDEIRCYIYYNGQFSRIPMNKKDENRYVTIKNMLKSLFIMKNNENIQYLGSEQIDGSLEVINDHIKDSKFDAFQKHVCRVKD